MAVREEEIDLPTSRSEEERAGLVGLAEALKVLAADQRDHRVAGWLQDVVDKVERFADTPTRNQMASALVAAEDGVHRRLDEVLGSLGEQLEELTEIVQGLVARAERIPEEEISRWVAMLNKHERFFSDLVRRGQLAEADDGHGA